MRTPVTCSRRREILPPASGLVKSSVQVVNSLLEKDVEDLLVRRFRLSKRYPWFNCEQR